MYPKKATGIHICGAKIAAQPEALKKHYWITVVMEARAVVTMTLIMYTHILRLR